jgi:hypothetical protein
MSNPRDEQAVKQLMNLAKGQNTLEIMLNLAKSLHVNGNKLFNSNPVLREAVLQDAQAAQLYEAKDNLPNLGRAIELGETVLGKFKVAGGLEQRVAIERLSTQLDKSSKEAGLYMAQQETTTRQLNEFIDNLPKIIDRMIADVTKAEEAAAKGGRGEPTRYTEYLNELKQSRKTLASLTGSIDMLKKVGATTLVDLNNNAKDTITCINGLSEAQKKLVGVLPIVSQAGPARPD